MNKHILGIDPGLAKFGYAITDYDLNLEAFNCVETKKGNARLKAVDDFIRYKQITRILKYLKNNYNIALICAESMSHPRAAQSAAKLARSWGVLGFFSEELSVPVIMLSPQEIKRSLTGATNASKQDIQDALRAKGYDLPKMAKAKLEHPADALAAIFACQYTQIFRAVVNN